MLAALLTGFLLFSGGNGLVARIFDKHTQASVREVVSDKARADAAVRTLKQGQHELKEAGKQFEKIAKAFNAVDKAQEAGYDQLAPIMERTFEQRHLAQGKTFDRLFELRTNLTEEEWNAFLEMVEPGEHRPPDGAEESVTHGG